MNYNDYNLIKMILVYEEIVPNNMINGIINDLQETDTNIIDLLYTSILNKKHVYIIKILINKITNINLLIDNKSILDVIFKFYELSFISETFLCTLFVTLIDNNIAIEIYTKFLLDYYSYNRNIIKYIESSYIYDHDKLIKSIELNNSILTKIYINKTSLLTEQLLFMATQYNYKDLTNYITSHKLLLQTNYENNTCSICISDIDMHNYIKTKCNHNFHQSCFIKLINHNFVNNIHNACPICRNNINLSSYVFLPMYLD